MHVGYFIKSIKRVAFFDRSSEPDRVLLDHEIPVLSIGWTGGGGLSVVDCELGGVMLLPPAALVDGRYDGTRTKVKIIADSVSRFLDLLLFDLRAFVKNESGHAYIV